MVEAARTEQPVGRLNDEAFAALAPGRTPRFLATRDAAGIPNIVPIMSLEAVDRETIIFREMMIWKTRRNLEGDQRLAICVLSADLRSWTVRGRFREFQAKGPLFERVAENESSRYNPYGGIRSVGVIQVVDVARSSALSPRALLVDTLRARWAGRAVGGRGPAPIPAQVEEKFSRLKAAKALGTVDADGQPDAFPAFPLVPAGADAMIAGGPAATELARYPAGAPVAAAVITTEPVAYQVKGALEGMQRGLGRRFAVIRISEAYSASPPLPGERLPARHSVR